MKSVDTLILPAVVANNQPVPHPTENTDNRKVALNVLGLGLVSGQIFAKALPSIDTMAVHSLEFGVDSASWYHKKYCE